MSTKQLRQRYELEVRALAQLAADLDAAGFSDEQIARALHKRRRRIGLKYKLRTPVLGPKGQIAIYRRNVKKYGHPLGPSIRWLRERGRTWDDIRDSACRSGGRDLK
ncbi:MAG TPA: hypothetical protein VF533_16820 [Solirubrobacteraceae bacterium]|jgi:hypothetical protein